MSEIDLPKVAARASEIFCDRAREAGRENLIPDDEVYGPDDVDYILAAWRADGAGVAIHARLEEMMADVQEKRAVRQALMTYGFDIDNACADEEVAQATLDGACVIARLVLGEEVEA